MDTYFIDYIEHITESNFTLLTERKGNVLRIFFFIFSVRQREKKTKHTHRNFTDFGKREMNLTPSALNTAHLFGKLAPVSAKMILSKGEKNNVRNWQRCYKNDPLNC